MLDDELLARLDQGIGVKIIKPRLFTHLCRPVAPARPNHTGLLGMPAKFGLAGTYANISLSVKANRLISRGANLKDNDPTIRMIDNTWLESCIRMQPRPNPGQQVLIALPFGIIGIKICADNLMCLIGNTEDKIASRLGSDAGRIRKRGQIFPDLLRFIAIALELQPFGFCRQTAQLINERDVLVSTHVNVLAFIKIRLLYILSSQIQSSKLCSVVLVVIWFPSNNHQTNYKKVSDLITIIYKITPILPSHFSDFLSNNRQTNDHQSAWAAQKGT